MFFIDLDVNKKVPKPKLFLAKPNKEIISPLFEVEPKISYKLNAINEMQFQIPAYIDEEVNNTSSNSIDKSNPKKIRNPHLDMINERFLIKVEYMDKDEWFVIIKKNDNGSMDRDYVDVNCYSLGYELKDDDISNYHTESSTLRQILLGNDKDNTKGILYRTQWNIGYIDKKYNKIYREFSTNGTVLNAILDIPKTFNCIIEFDTENRLLNFYYKDNYGRDTGIVFDYNKYLKSVSRTKDTDKDAMCTRLKVFGKDGLSIESMNPTGQEYIDDFTYYMYPFEMNKKGEIIKHSVYMSDELCVALVKYKIKILQHKGKFRELIDKKQAYSKLRIYKDQELNSLKNQLQIFDDKYTVSRNSGNSIIEIKTIKDKIQRDIENKKTEIKEIKKVIDKTNKEIDIIHKDLLEKNNFSNRLLEELYQFVIVNRVEIPTSDEVNLYKQGLKELARKSKPKVSINISLVDFKKCVSEQYMWDKLKLGDKVRVSYPLLNINEEVRYGIDNYSPNDEDGDI